jgi:hypothetical protein
MLGYVLFQGSLALVVFYMIFRRMIISLLISGIVALTLVGCSSSVSGTGTNLAPVSPSVSGTGTNLTSGSAHDFTQQGSIEFVVKAQCPAEAAQCNIVGQLPTTVSVLQTRLQKTLQITDAYLTTHQDTATHAILIAVDIPQKYNKESGAVRDELVSPILEFLDTSGEYLYDGQQITPGSYPVVFTDRDIDHHSINVSIDQAGQPQIDFEMQGAVHSRFATYTQQHIGEYLTIALDWNIIESAVIQREIDGAAVISGSMTLAQANTIASLLSVESVPLDLVFVSQQTKPAGG